MCLPVPGACQVSSHVAARIQNLRPIGSQSSLTMPRILFASESEPKDESVVASPDAATPKSDSLDDSTATSRDGYGEHALQLHSDREIIKARDNLHPYVQTLSISNLEDCVALENAVFPEHERCSRGKVGRILVHSIFCNFRPPCL